MTLGCHDRRQMSSLAFEREWNLQPKLFCVRDFAGLKVVAFLSGSAAPATGDSSIAVTSAAAKGVASSDAPQTFVISRALKAGSITATVSRPTGNVELLARDGSRFPRSALLRAISPCRRIRPPAAAGNGSKSSPQLRAIHDLGMPCCVLCHRPGRFVDAFSSTEVKT